ncbi:MAG: hypothetical protein AABW50_02030 [Nanoarchaeota archaeon]
MTEIIKFEDWVKLDLRIGEVEKINPIVISCLGKGYEIELGLAVKKGDKIVVGLSGDNLVIPVVGEDVPLAPGKGAEAGMKVS